MYSKKTNMYCKIETTSGTDVSPATTDGVIAYDIDLSIKADMKERNASNADRSIYPNIRGKTTAELKFWIELKGGAAVGTAPKWAPLLKACDRLETANAGTNVIYTPAVTGQTCTIYVNIDGILHKLVGCAGDCEIDLTAADIAKLVFTMSGVYALPTDSAIAAITADTTAGLIVKAAPTTLGGYSAVIEKMNLKFGNKVVERTSMAVAEAVLAFMVGDRNPTGIITCEMVILTTTSANFWSYFDAGTTKALSMVLGSAGNMVTIVAPVCKLSAPKYGDREGLRTVDLEFQMARSAGSDEMTITLT
jgi:hypothetical protein